LDDFYEEIRPRQEAVARQWIESVRADRARKERHARNSDRAVTIALIALGISAVSAATGIAVLLIQLTGEPWRGAPLGPVAEPRWGLWSRGKELPAFFVKPN
jgi:hypothetical protein